MNLCTCEKVLDFKQSVGRTSRARKCHVPFTRYDGPPTAAGHFGKLRRHRAVEMAIRRAVFAIVR